MAALGRKLPLATHCVSGKAAAAIRVCGSGTHRPLVPLYRSACLCIRGLHYEA